MSMNESMIKGKWLEIKGEIQKAWGKLTDDELEQTKGDAKAIGGLIEQRYGEKKETYGTKMDEIFQRFDVKKDAAVEGVKDSLRN